MQAINEIKQTRKRQPKQVVPQLIEKQTAPIEEQERTEFRGRPKKYTSQEEAERVAAEQRQRAQQR
ncbi:MAG: hypothetical protein EZS28_045424, partial [Streblomastix strix]